MWNYSRDRSKFWDNSFENFIQLIFTRWMDELAAILIRTADKVKDIVKHIINLKKLAFTIFRVNQITIYHYGLQF